MKNHSLIRLPFLLLPLLNACTKEDFPYPKAYPVVITDELLEMDESGVTFYGELFTVGTQPIQSYGFLWSGSDATEQRISVTGNLAEGKFSHRLATYLPAGVNYTYRAFVETADQLVMGNIRQFISVGNAVPRILSFTPASGTDGTLVTLTAINLSTDPEQNLIYVQGELVKVISSTENTLIFEMPVTNYHGAAEIALQIGLTGQAGAIRVLAPEKFMVLGPQIDNISRIDAFPGEEITIRGKHFSAYGTDVYVRIGGEAAGTVALSDEELTIIVPSVEYSLLADFAGELELFTAQKSAVYRETFTIKRSWEGRSEVPVAGAWAHNGFTYGGKGYVLDPVAQRMYDYDPLSDQWTTLGAIPEGIHYGRNLSFVYNQKLIVLEGTDLTGTSGQVWEYDLTSGQWQEGTVMPFSFQYATGVMWGNRFYVITGWGEVWTYRPDDRTFIRKQDVPAKFAYAGSAFEQDGEFLLVDDQATWRYFPDLDTWTFLHPNRVILNSSEFLGFSHGGTNYLLQSGRYLYKYLHARREWRPVSSFPGCGAYNYSDRVAFTFNDQAYLAEFHNPDDPCVSGLYKFQP
ncbi:IPT/TIG domain-containing protein [Flavilitoribacter nigricans]|uniref:IPT/TIG domain-containing protein n=1 Tax=Flavilitoribacter nigricans (strain ATCC 23147 / DSM 23189 / NBRC 102662 / NCIMB 1420 / SS-2) TaxID=1122177 RepID=A0A2D0NBL9_FLAN2|nr:IPT/TIG domain-containing protein [Flavilitoribacter nigricans]PHN05778.1 hypothetical protein CRP01_14995 [Flavilitoribacter nigricans DSM 23189 = NBRC 102662]